MITLFDYQAEDRAKVADAFLRDGVTRQLGVWPTGCHAYGQGILMADGTVKEVQDIRAGDSVMGPDSKPRFVYALRGGYDDMYEVIPVKGEPWIVNGQHVLTLVRTREGGRRKDRDGKLVNVRVVDWLAWSKTQKHLHKLLRVGVDFQDEPDDRKPISPYFLGVLLGDGGLTRGITVTTTDVEIFTACVRQAREFDLDIRLDGTTAPTIHFSKGWDRSNRLKKGLVEIGLAGLDSEKKFIPLSYKRASRASRLEILAGLLDTDGSLAGGGFDYVTKSQQLAADVAFVARSLGLAAYVQPCYKKCQTGAIGVYHRVSISGDCYEIPTRLPRKQATARSQKKSVLRTGFTIRATGDLQRYYGFTLDGDHRYLLDDFTVTHNSGKTVLFSELHLEPKFQEWLDDFLSWQRKILVIAHRDELIKQAVDKLRRSNPDAKIGVEKAGQRHNKDTDDIVVASVQTLTAAGGKRLKQMNPREFRIVVLDEAHHAASPSYYAVLQHFGFLPPPHYMESLRPTREEGREKLLEWQRLRLEQWQTQADPNRLLLGVTATPKRGDNIGLECVFQQITFNRSIREMIERGRLSRIRAFRVKTNTDISEVTKRAGDFSQDELATAVNVDNRNAKAVRAYLDYANGRKGITFCVNIAHAVSMAQAYNAAGVPTRAIHGNLSDGERAQILEDYRAGKIRMLTNCQILTEGFDEPDVQVIVHARPTQSALLYIQMTGRGIRVAPGKTDCIIIDIVDITRRHSLITAPELLGLPQDYDAKGGDLLGAKVQLEELAKAHPLADFTDVKDIEECQIRVEELDLLDSFRDDNLDAHAKMAWLKNKAGGYELSWRGDIVNEKLVISPQATGPAFGIEHKWGEARVIWQETAKTAQEAFQKAEDRLTKEAPQMRKLLFKEAPWRAEPVSEVQKSSLRRLGVRINVDELTKGQANDLLSKLYAESRARK